MSEILIKYRSKKTQQKPIVNHVFSIQYHISNLKYPFYKCQKFWLNIEAKNHNKNQLLIMFSALSITFQTWIAIL